MCRSGEIGRRTGLKIPRWKHCVGSSPTPGTIQKGDFMQATDCIFCKIISGEIPSSIIEQNDYVIVIKDISPRAPIHYLIIPKKHIPDLRSLQECDKDIASEMLFMTKKLSEKLPAQGEFKLVMNNGASVGQCVFHAHMHFLVGKKSVDV